jgi:hypothetical protein
MRPSDENGALPRSILTKLLVRKWEYRHPRFFLRVRLASGLIDLALGILLLRYKSYWGLLPLAGGVLALSLGPYIYTVARDQQAGA